MGGEVAGEIIKTLGTVGCVRNDLDFMYAYVHRTLLTIGYVPLDHIYFDCFYVTCQPNLHAFVGMPPK
jgi:hypothetical protein